MPAYSLIIILMFLTLGNVCALLWGNTISTVDEYHLEFSTVESIQYCWGYHSTAQMPLGYLCWALQKINQIMEKFKLVSKRTFLENAHKTHLHGLGLGTFIGALSHFIVVFSRSRYLYG